MKSNLIHERIPGHIAIIMDGNGRWAKSRQLTRTQGHMEGVKRVEEIVEEARGMGVRVLTLFTFSMENWSRPKEEVSILMELLISALNKKINKFKENNVRFQIIGREEYIPEKVIKTMHKAVEVTENNTGLILNLAFNYGSRIEILDAVKKIILEVQKGGLKVDDVNEEVFNQALYTKDLPDPDLLIRTSGEQRISNFLLWQLSYSEFYFADKYWPDFTVKEFRKAIEVYQKRERRYGTLLAKN